MDEELDLMLGPLKTAYRMRKALDRWREGPVRKALYENHYQEWIEDLAMRVQSMANDQEEYERRLDAFSQDHERLLILGNVGIEAWREAIERRREMLKGVAVGTFYSDLSAVELARIERTFRMLDPEDLDFLEELSRLDLSQLGRDEKYEAWTAALASGYLGGSTLVASGCVRYLDPIPSNVILDSTDPRDPLEGITTLGHLILDFSRRFTSKVDET